MVPEIWSMANKFFCHLGQFSALLPPNDPENQNFKKNEKDSYRYNHFTHAYHKWQSYDVWFLRSGARRREFFVILEHFLPFYLPNNPKNQNFEKMKKFPGDIIILHKYTKNHDHMIHYSWDKMGETSFLFFPLG